MQYTNPQFGGSYLLFMTDTDQNYDLCAITVTPDRLSLANVNSGVGTIFINTTSLQGILQNANFSCMVICPAT